MSLTVGTMLGGMVATAFGLQGPQMPPAVDMRLLGLLSLVGGVAMAVGLAEIARRSRGGFRSRWLSLAWFACACMGITNTIEAAFYTTVGGAVGGWPFRGCPQALCWLP